MPENLKVLTQKQEWLLIHQISADLEANFNIPVLSVSPLGSEVAPATGSPVDISSSKQTWQESVFFQVPLVYYDSFSVILKHSSIVILPEVGSLRAFLGLGWRVYESERFDGVLAHQFGGHLGIELQLRL
jgi:hypothetical protein